MDADGGSALRPRHRRLARRAGGTRFWRALKALGPWWAELPPYQAPRDPRVAAFAVLAVALGAYYAWHEQLVDLSKWWNIAFLALCLIPSIFALVYLALPYRTSHGLLLLALALLVLVVLLELSSSRCRASRSSP